MTESSKSHQNEDVGSLLISMEKATVAAFKDKREKDFTAHFSASYIGIADDGFKTGADEVAGMKKLDLQDLTIEGERAAFPAPNVGIVTYTMNVKGVMGRQPVAGKIFTSTVYVQDERSWSAVLHTEAMQPAGK